MLIYINSRVGPSRFIIQPWNSDFKSLSPHSHGHSHSLLSPFHTRYTVFYVYRKVVFCCLALGLGTTILAAPSPEAADGEWCAPARTDYGEDRIIRGRWKSCIRVSNGTAEGVVHIKNTEYYWGLAWYGTGDEWNYVYRVKFNAFHDTPIPGYCYFQKGCSNFGNATLESTKWAIGKTDHNPWEVNAGVLTNAITPGDYRLLVDYEQEGPYWPRDGMTNICVSIVFEITVPAA